MPRAVCFFTESTSVGGAELAMAQQLTALDRSRWEPMLLHTQAPDLEPFTRSIAAAGVDVRAIEAMPEGLSGARALPRFVQELRRLRPDVFHAHLTWPMGAKFALAGAVGARVPAVVATVHAFPPAIVTRQAMLQRRMLARRVDQWIVASHHAGQALGRLIPQAAGRTTLIPNAVDPGRFSVKPSARLRSALSDDGRYRVVLIAARLDERKGHDVALEACLSLPGVRIVLAGDGPLRPALEERAMALGLADRVRFLGFRTDMPDLLAACDVACLPTLDEAFGLSVLEAMLARRPVVASQCGALPELIDNGVTGLLVPPSDPASLAGAIRLLLSDDALARRLAETAHTQAAAIYAPGSVSGRVSAVYDRCLGSAVERVA